MPTLSTAWLREKLLSFMMALEVSRNWAPAFDGIYTQSPSWYHGANVTDFRPRNLTVNLSQLSAAAGAVMTSAPRSTGDSGFSGGSSGGFSDGSFGGGGGRGF